MVKVTPCEQKKKFYVAIFLDVDMETFKKADL